MVEKLDVIIFGATGFTGKYTVKELNTILKDKPLKWGIAGRSEEKLKQILDELKVKTGDDFSHVRIIVADIKDEESIKKMTEQAKVIVNCCGPYRFFGEPVIKACIASGTHYVDVCGEAQFMERMQLEYHKAALERGVYIVSSCGFDCIPCDMGLVYLEQMFDGTVNEVETYVIMKTPPGVGGAQYSYGAYESAIYGMAHDNELAPLRSKLFPESLPEFKPKQKARPALKKSALDDGNYWVIPFLGTDQSVMQRSQRHFYEHDQKRPVQVECYMGIPSLLSVLGMGMFGSMFQLLAKFSCGRNLLMRHPQFFTAGWVSLEGPSQEMMENTKFSFILIGKGWSRNKALAELSDQHTGPLNKTATVKVSGVNPGYGATCVMLALCGLTILKESDKMPEIGGVYPPGAAFANTSLIQQLNKNGVTYELVSSAEI